MNSKAIATVTVFAGLTVALNLSPVKIPAPYAPFLIYQVWEIPIVTAFLLYGPKVGVVIAIINTLVLFVLFPGALPTGPLYNLAAVLSMLLGIYLIYKFVAKSFGKQQEAKIASTSTAFGIIIRVGVMTVVNWSLLRFPPPVGFGIPEEGIIAILPIIGLFNATLALYTIPVGYFLARAVSVGTKLQAWSEMGFRLKHAAE